MKLLRKLLLFFIALLFLSVGLIYIALTTNIGSRYVIQLATIFVPEVTVKNIKGNLWSGIIIGSIRYKSTELAVDAKKVKVSCHLSELLQKKLNCNQLLVDHLTLDLPNNNNNPPTTNEAKLLLPAIEIPVDILLKKLSITKVLINIPSGSWLLANTFGNEIKLENSTLSWQQISLGYQENTIDLTGSIKLKEHYSTTINTSLLISEVPQLPQQLLINEPLNADILINGDLNELKFGINTSGPVTMEANGYININNFVKPNLSLEGKWHKLPNYENAYVQLVNSTGKFSLVIKDKQLTGSIESIINTVNWPSTTLNVDFDLTLPTINQPLTIKASSNIVTTDSWQVNEIPQLPQSFLINESLNAKVEIDGNLDQVMFDILSTGPIAIEAKGLLKTNNFIKPELTLEGKWHKLPPYQNDYIQLVNSTGKFLLTLNHEQLLGNIASIINTKNWPSTTLTTNFDISLPSANQSLKLKTSGNIVTADSWQISENLINPGVIDGNWDIVWQNDELLIDNAQLKLNNAQARIQGAIADDFNINFNANIPKLDEIFQHAKGSLTTKGYLAGTIKEPKFNIETSIKNIDWQDLSADLLHLNAHSNTVTSVTIELKGKTIDYKNMVLDDFNFLLDGNYPQHHFTLTANEKNQNSLLVNGEGSYIDAAWKGNINDLIVNHQSLGLWKIKEKTELLISQNKQQLEPLCIESTLSSEVCASVILQEKNNAIEIKSTQFALNIINQFMPEAFKLTGNLDLDLQAKQIDGNWQGMLTSNVISSSINFQTDENAFTEDIATGKLTANLDNKTLTMELGLALENQQTANAKATLYPLDLTHPIDEVNIEGNWQINWEYWDWITKTLVDISIPQGKLTSDGQITGTLTKPIIDTQLNLTDGQFDIPELGVTFENINVTATAKPNEPLIFNGNVQSNDSQLSLEGHWQWQQNPTNLTAKLSGKNFLLVNNTELQLYASPNLDFLFKDNIWQITGETLLPIVSVSITRLPTSVVSVSNDVIVINKETEELDNNINFTTDLLLTLGDEVVINGFGLSATMGGQLNLIKKHQKDVNAKGEILITSGSYEAFGQKIDIETGKLLFNGPIDNPNMQLRASKKLDKQTVGILANGTLQTHQISVFSDPVIDERDALSYLVFGRSLSDTSSSEGNFLLTNASRSLGFEGGSIIGNQIIDRLGLSNININTSAKDDQSQIEVGAYLSPKLTVSYGQQLFDDEDNPSIWKARYTINNSLSLEATSEERGGVDVIYEISWE